MSNSLLRLKQMLLGWGTVGVIYNFSDYLQGEGYQLTPSIIDNLIAFSPSAVWLYLSFDQMGISAGALNRLIAIDSSQNCFPSLHAALTLLAVWAIAKKGNRWLTLMSVVWAIAIAFSILQLRRHLFIDLVGGALLASICGWICATCEKRKTQYE